MIKFQIKNIHFHKKALFISCLLLKFSQSFKEELDISIAKSLLDLERKRERPFRNQVQNSSSVSNFLIKFFCK